MTRILDKNVVKMEQLVYAIYFDYDFLIRSCW